MAKADAGLRKLFREHLPRVDWCAVESGQTSKGIPDTNFCHLGVEGWIEMKKADRWRVEIRSEQVGWIERRLDRGGRVFVAVRRAQSELWLFHGSAIRPLLTQSLEDVPWLCTWVGGPARWDWAKVLKILTGKIICK